MPRAEAAEVHYYWQDHDSDVVNEFPPVQNTWYELFDAVDVRLLLNTLTQDNDEAAAKNVEVRWTIDTNVYLAAFAANDGALYYIYRTHLPSTGGTSGLERTETALNAARYVDKRGLAFKVEARLTGVPGTNQRLRAWAVRETHVQT